MISDFNSKDKLQNHAEQKMLAAQDVYDRRKTENLLLLGTGLLVVGFVSFILLVK